ncbi:ribbon-helix-helix protein, CopG family [Ilyomonas limi]|jgi:hypothetical protein|uniref:Ribbon-helix-helix protein, CopG family n=1 Tax=Ilyomonas limi TaxID=2575867 RepID=A0A4U3KX83_9BACT|nr:DUF6364 family protein [Ilyomonas limi]TKK67168.1 ribbon-helix-helix protein, CopG family [Ilyomonas limi]
MKARLNLTVDEELLDKVRVYAEKKQKSISQIVEEYFSKITKEPKKESIIDLIESLPKPNIDPDIDLKKTYYEENRKKYGF